MNMLKQTQKSKVVCCLSLEFETKLAYLPQITKIVEGLCRMRGLNGDLEYEIVLVINEIVSNSIEHAYLRDESPTIKMNIQINNNAFNCELFEKNPLVYQEEIKQTSVERFLDSEGKVGFGIALINHYMDEVKRLSIEDGYKWIIKKILH